MTAEAEHANWRRALTGPLGLLAWLFLLVFMAPAPASWASALRSDAPLQHVQHAPPRGLKHLHGPSRDLAVLAGQGSDEKHRQAGDAWGLAPTAPTRLVRIGVAIAFADHPTRSAQPARRQAYQARAPPSLSRRADRPGAPLTQHL